MAFKSTYTYLSNINYKLKIRIAGKFDSGWNVWTLDLMK